LAHRHHAICGRTTVDQQGPDAGQVPAGQPRRRPDPAPLEEPRQRAEADRWAIEDGFEAAENELGLDYDATRSWHGWHRHVSLVMLACAMPAAIRRQANEGPPPKTAGGTRRARS
jgi:SRSO17 transposase